MVPVLVTERKLPCRAAYNHFRGMTAKVTGQTHDSDAKKRELDVINKAVRGRTHANTRGSVQGTKGSAGFIHLS